MLLSYTVLPALSNGELRSGQVSTLPVALIPAAKNTGKTARSISLQIKSSDCLNGAPCSTANRGSKGGWEGQQQIVKRQSEKEWRLNSNSLRSSNLSDAQSFSPAPRISISNKGNWDCHFLVWFIQPEMIISELNSCTKQKPASIKKKKEILLLYELLLICI